MGHASVSITFDRYGHLMPGNESEAAGMLDAYLARAASARQARDTEPLVDAVESGRRFRSSSGIPLYSAARGTLRIPPWRYSPTPLQQRGLVVLCRYRTSVPSLW